MTALRRVWTKVSALAHAFDGIDDPTGDYVQSLGKRVDKLERDLENLERSLPARANSGGTHLAS